MRKFIIKIIRDECGASLAEYIITVLFIGFAAIVAYNLFPAAIQGYLQKVLERISLPIP